MGLSTFFVSNSKFASKAEDARELLKNTAANHVRSAGHTPQQIQRPRMKFENAGSRFPYSVADTESGPMIEVPEDGTLRLTFTDYKCQPVSLIFDDLLGVKYQSSTLDVSGWAEDSAIEVIDSEWLRDSCGAENLDPARFRHLTLDLMNVEWYLRFSSATSRKRTKR